MRAHRRWERPLLGRERRGPARDRLDERDRDINPKFGHKLDFLDEMRDWIKKDKIAEGVKNDTLFSLLEKDISEGRKYYDRQVDPAVAQEIVRVAQRSDISEELARFRGHLAHWITLVEAQEPCGRKLDFLVQEMNREINTIGSKIEGGRGTQLVIDAKAELERMREQVQNLE